MHKNNTGNAYKKYCYLSLYLFLYDEATYLYNYSNSLLLKKKRETNP